MSMSKKDFEAIADIIQRYRRVPTADRAVMDAIAIDLGLYFQKQNPRFDMERFLKATGMK